MTDMSLRAIRERWDVEDDIRRECSQSFFVEDACHVLTTAKALHEALATSRQYIVVQLALENISDGLRSIATCDLERVDAALALADGEKHE